MIFSSAIRPVPSVCTITDTGSAHADRVGQLHQRAISEAGRDDVLGDVARHVARRAIDLGRILARERAAAVRRRAAVGVDDDLAAR